MTTQTKVKPETPESRAGWEKAAQQMRRLIASWRRQADKLAAEGTPESRKEAMNLRCKASYEDNRLEDLTEFVERRGQWATGKYVKAKREKRA
jgi:hypothetical protein